MEWARHVVCIRETRSSYNMLVGNREVQSAVQRQRAMMVDTLKRILKELV
jgi:hypothetical protein